MRLKILLTLAGTALASLSYAQKNKQLTAFAITGPQKGQNNWTEVRLVDMNTGSEVRPVYQSAQDVELLNARTGKPIVKKDPAADNDASKEVIQVTRRDPD